MDTALLVIGFVLTLVGVIGSFLPVLPGPLTGWVGLLLLHLTEVIPMNYTFLGVTFAAAVLIYILDYFVPAIGTKRFGGTKYGVYGTTIGLIVGILAPIPFGFIIGPFVGALVGEILAKQTGPNAIKAAFGPFLGFLAGTFMKFILACVYVGLFVLKAWEYKDVLF